MPTAYDPEFLMGLYRTMLRIRLCEESLVAPIVSGEVRCPVHLYSGEEAVATGVCAALESTDYVFGSHRSHGHYLAKGGDMRALVAEVFCKASGCAKGRGGSMHLLAPEVGMIGAAPIVAGTISLAVGAALASRVRHDRRVSVAFFGDGAAGEGVLYESMNLASLKKLPVLFVCENNLYSTHMPIRECRISEEIYRVAEPFGIQALRVDGNDVLAVYAAAHDSVESCRLGSGPVFLECLTYRLRGHVGPDDNIQGDHTDIRPPEEVAAWKAKDPLLRLAAALEARGAAGNSALEALRLDVEEEVRGAVLSARHDSFPSAEELEYHVYQ